ncbi:anti-repressor SinI family protein [Virgibacillus sp. C22-A2]|uniref:Anti-repressor SinI family protein n=1 Tax=Virgibacillus tibetensis TaxID=3042313 RepID=A0ABU6KDM5_9BACI|nr:anti-repressor SinI family protein [Virgibacillus sp. C22-A2]
MTKEKANIKSHTQHYDQEWIYLIALAKQTGLSKSQVRNYLKKNVNLKEKSSLTNHSF